ncbi:MAG TPA: DUF3738 domain-containing protein, partial [Verrucomicrobiae bacterium]|nr:DUF3738 domain-containing protein [Verrucomicrobiae bacterium]
KTILTIGGAIFILAAMTTVVKSQPSSAVNDGYFEPNADKLRQVSANLAVVQPTHFQETPGKIKHVYDGDSLARTVGRNVTFRDLMAEAYDCEPGCVVLPPDAPKGGFDFVVTESPKTRKHLREAIKTALGYTATPETRDTEVLILQGKDSSAAGLAVSTASDDDINYRDGKLYFTRQPMSIVVKGLEEGFALPVVDQTGLTNNYDFSVTWNGKVMQAMRDGGFHFDGAQTVLNGWGLELKPDTARLEMFTVKKTH